MNNLPTNENELINYINYIKQERNRPDVINLENIKLKECEKIFMDLESILPSIHSFYKLIQNKYNVIFYTDTVKKFDYMSYDTHIIDNVLQPPPQDLLLFHWIQFYLLVGINSIKRLLQKKIINSLSKNFSKYFRRWPGTILGPAVKMTFEEIRAISKFRVWDHKITDGYQLNLLSKYVSKIWNTIISVDTKLLWMTINSNMDILCILDLESLWSQLNLSQEEIIKLFSAQNDNDRNAIILDIIDAGYDNDDETYDHSNNDDNDGVSRTSPTSTKDTLLISTHHKSKSKKKKKK